MILFCHITFYRKISLPLLKLLPFLFFSFLFLPLFSLPNIFMDISGSSRFRHRQTPSTDRFLGTPPQLSSTAVNTADTEDNELHEDDIFSTGDFSEASNAHHHYSPTASHKTTFAQPESFGILAALPEHRINSHSHLYQKTAINSSTSTASSSRFIPSIPKPPHERLPMSPSSSKFHHQPQSVPVNVPVMAMRHKVFEEDDDDEAEGEGTMLPPHEIVARAQLPMVACSVLEGVGRTLKGRDLRQVRNAVWRRTGFLD